MQMAANPNDMNDTPSSNRIPLALALAAALILLAVGGYIFWRQTALAEPSADEPKIGVASGVADKAAADAGMKPGERKAVEAIVRAYILEHPEIIPEAVEVLQKREAAKRLASAGGKMATPFPGAVAGNPNGDVTVVEFTDYNCGYCRASVPDVQKLVGSDKGVRVIYREVPILSPTSRDAALWALAAAKQGKHKAFHDAMFSGARPDAQSIRAAAAKAGMDLPAAEKFAGSPIAIAEVDSNLAMMQQVGFSGTPTFIIGDQILEGALGYEALKSAVERARKRG
jgi:protein-disulfide isomerase